MNLTASLPLVTAVLIFVQLLVPFLLKLKLNNSREFDFDLRELIK
jgi:hypothetical protein